MIDRKRLLDDLRKLVTKLEKDLRERCEQNAEVDARVRVEYEQAKEAKRTAQDYKIWRDEWITQVAVAWVLGAVFVRFIEDNELIATPFIAGPGQRLEFAKEQRTAFFRQNPTLSDREYLEHVFREVAKLPAMKELYDERHNPLWALGVSGDGAKLILDQFQKTEPTGALVHDFTDPAWETRFLGDLYQDLSESARNKYALWQTPEFIEEFILDRTLNPAIAEFGLGDVRMIDPTCGSGHFLLGAFSRIFELWEAREPATNRIVLAQRALDSVFGVDLNPYAVAISRFRLLVMALKVGAVKRLVDAPDHRVNLAVGDSLLHGSPGVGGAAQSGWSFAPIGHLYQSEERDALETILKSGAYHAVVGNPPYISVKDQALNEAYRGRFTTCFRKYSLVAPFIERCFDLSVPSGYVGLITANSFMKREFGKKLITEFLSKRDLTHVIDTSGASIPGHATPTVILLARRQHPIADTVRMARGIRQESPNVVSAERVVWRAILAQIDSPGTTSAYVSVDDISRDLLARHPWSMGGGGAADLKAQLDDAAERTLGELVKSIGFAAIFGEDDAFIRPANHVSLRPLSQEFRRPLVDGDLVRDWRLSWDSEVLFPYSADIALSEDPQITRWLWPNRTVLWNRADFGHLPYRVSGRSFAEYHQIPADKQRTASSIVFADVATHNHFVFDRGRKLFNRHAPVIKLPESSTEDDHIALISLLNSSTACFWARQTFFPKGGFTAGKWEERLEWDGTKLARFPIPAEQARSLGRLLDAAAREYCRMLPESLLASGVPSLDEWVGAKETAERLRRRMYALQEELDWNVYRLYGLLVDDLTCDVSLLPNIELGQRAFEILMAREPSDFDGAWFARHGATPTQDTPDEWPDDYARLVERRIQTIRDVPSIGLIERPESKRRWTMESWLVQAERALRNALLARLEEAYLGGYSLKSVARLSGQMMSDDVFQRVAETYRASRDYDLFSLVADLVEVDAVPSLPIDRYKESGLRKRQAWEETWSGQRRQDAGEQVGDIPVPPKYKSSDFKSSRYWSLRGKLDVPKERFISFPGCERESDSSLPILWAGYDHLQQAKAIAAYYQDLKAHEGAGPAKLGKLLACILELLPWLKQWHNDVDPEYGTRMGDFFETFMLSEMSSLGLSMEDVRKIRGL